MSPTSAPDTARLASDLRVVLGRLMRRLRAEHRFSLSQAAVLGRLDREGAQSVSQLAAAERVRPQSMAQTVAELEAEGLLARRQREGWLAQAIAALSPEEQRVLDEAVGLLRRLVEG